MRASGRSRGSAAAIRRHSSAVGVALVVLLAGPAVASALAGPVIADAPAGPVAASADQDERTPTGATPAGDARVDHEGARVTLEAGPAQPIRGESTLLPGTALSVSVRATGANPLLRSVTAVVDRDGRFRALVDLSDVPNGTALEVRVSHDGALLATARARVRDCEAPCPSSLPDDPMATVDREGESLTLDAGRSAAVAGRSNLPAGTELTVQLREQPGGALLVDAPAVVDGTGRFRAVFDLRGLAPGSSSRVVVVDGGTRLAAVDATVVDCSERCGSVAGRPSLPVVDVPVDGVVRIDASLGDAGARRLVVGEPESGYGLEATLRDGDGDGRVPIRLNASAAAGGEGATLTAVDPADEIAVRTERDALSVTEYRLVLYPAGNATEPIATGLVIVTEDGDPGSTPPPTDPGEGPSPDDLVPVVALVVGTLLAVGGVATLLGVVER